MTVLLTLLAVAGMLVSLVAIYFGLVMEMMSGRYGMSYLAPGLIGFVGCIGFLIYLAIRGGP